MDYAYSIADVVISRAGAGAISELCIVGKPSVLVPLPTAAEDHQTKNAMALVNKNAAMIEKESNAKQTLLLSAFFLLDNETKMKEISANCKSLAKPNSTNMIANEVLKLANYTL
jgi:UDP-N-acetylglucosamine--N-acetylmuramyl-(pentapeptide) pyrophosphoryl-undecaprenol N-acetylglucosamine transferase